MEKVWHEYWGKYIYRVREVKKAKRSKALAWDEKAQAQVMRLGVLRILGLKEKVLKLKNHETKN